VTLTGARAATVPSAESDAATVPSVESPAARRGRRPFAWAIAAAAPVAVAAVLTAGLGVATVQNDSMSPTLRGGDTVAFDRWSAPARGDVVLLVDREGWSGTPDALLVKRVVGVEGDVVVCCEAGTGRLVVNGQPVDEPYAGASRPGGDIPFRVTVPDDAVWVMGDNRAASADSRLSVSEPGHGGVPLADLRGVARLWWS
jgi:signal peptidase I